MMYIADLHIHSLLSRATSRDCDLPHLDWWAGRKGIGLLGTGDFTHPAWRAELREQLTPAGEGVYALREDLRLPHGMTGEPPRFVITGEISSIYKRDGKTRKVHKLILLPSLEAADELSARLEAIGNIHSDGRPILGLDSRALRLRGHPPSPAGPGGTAGRIRRRVRHHLPPDTGGDPAAERAALPVRRGGAGEKK